MPHANRSIRALICLPLVAISLLVVIGVSAHAELERSVPAADAVLSAPPQTIDLWMTEPVANGAGSPDVRLLAEDGTAVSVSEVAVDPSDPRHVTAKVEGAGFGTFTVAWTTRSDTDGHTLSGTYAFRVGGTNRAPGAATVEGERPQPWAVVTRWLTFLAAAIALAGLLAPSLFANVDESEATSRRRILLVSAAAGVGVIATAAEPLLQRLMPPDGAATPSLSDAINGLPTAWYLRIPGLLVAGGLALLVGRRSTSNRPVIAWVGAAAGAIAMLGLALTSHASARESWRLPAVLSVVIHQWSVGLWAGGLLHLVLSKPLTPGPDGRTPLARFSRLALPLALIGITTGVINAGLILPALSSLWESDYGRVMLAKVAILLLVLAFAAYHRLSLRRAADQLSAKLGLTLRLEIVAIAMVVLGGVILALLAPPATKGGTASMVDLSGQIGEGTANPDPDWVRFQITPADQGENSLAVAVTAGPPVSFGDNGGLVDAPPVQDIALVRVTLTSLQQEIAPVELDLTPDGTGWFRLNSVQIGLDGWWRADVLVRRLGMEDASIPFYFMVPDPNVHGESAPNVPKTTDDAQATYERGLAAMTGLTSVHFTERLAGGTGTAVFSDHITHADTDEGPATMRIATSDSEVIRSDGIQWLRDANGDWTRTDAGPVVPPSEWGTDYVNAAGIRLGRTEQIGDRTAQIVTFKVPGELFATAWYAWWVDIETGNILRETMISRGHYMLRNFDGFNAAPPVELPTDDPD